MPKKYDSNIVLTALQKNLDSPLVRQIMEEINSAAAKEEAKKEDKAKEKPAKKQFVILISDPEGKLPKDDFAGWVLQISEEESPHNALPRIYHAADTFNQTKKGRLFPVKTVGETLESAPAKTFTEVNVWVKTKTPVLVLRTDNTIKRHESE